MQLEAVNAQERHGVSAEIKYEKYVLYYIYGYFIFTFKYILNIVRHRIVHMIHLLDIECIRHVCLWVLHVIPRNLLCRPIRLSLKLLKNGPKKFDMPRVLLLIFKRRKEILVCIRNAVKVLECDLNPPIHDLDCTIHHCIRFVSCGTYKKALCRRQFFSVGLKMKDKLNLIVLPIILNLKWYNVIYSNSRRDV